MAAFRKLDAALRDAGKANPDDFTALSAACSKVVAAVTAVQSAGPLPYKPAERWLARALAQYSAGSADCAAGTQSGDAREIEESASHVSQGSVDLGKMNKALSRLGS